MGDHQLSAIPHEARSFQGHRAGVVSRVVAAAVDAAIGALVLVGAYLAVSGARFLVNPRTFHFPDLEVFTSLLAWSLVLGSYLTVAWAVGGRTFGNVLMGLRVVDARGDDLGWVRSAVRALAYVLVPTGIVWIAVDGANRSLQDLALRTAVV